MMEHKDLISIVVPIYNLEKYVGKCLESLLSQSYDNLEIIVVDDGSVDGSRRVVEELAHADRRIKPFYKKNEGVALARRDGIALATGDYVMFIDGDDYLDADCVGLLYAALADGADMAAARIMRLTSKYCSPVPRHVEVEVSGDRFLRHLLRHDIFAGVASVMYRRELLQGLRFCPDISLWEDFLMNLQIALNPRINKVCFVDEALYYYVQRPGTGNRQSVSADYLMRFCSYVAEVLSSAPAISSKYPVDILADRMHWFSIYISKSHNPWIGATTFARALCNDVSQNRKELVRAGVSRSLIRMILMYPHEWMRPFWRMSVLVGKWRKSYERRRDARK